MAVQALDWAHGDKSFWACPVLNVHGESPLDLALDRDDHATCAILLEACVPPSKRARSLSCSSRGGAGKDCRYHSYFDHEVTAQLLENLVSDIGKFLKFPDLLCQAR